MPVLGHLSFRESIRDADRRGVSPYDLDETLRDQVAEVYSSLARLVGPKEDRGTA
jgi:hypothetical protein